jgi:uncharacterized protein
MGETISLPTVWQRAVDALAAEIHALYGTRLVTLALYGSLGRGTPSTESDIDFLVIARDLPPSRMERTQEFAAAEESWEKAARTIFPAPYPPCLSPLIKSPEEAALGSPLFLDMVEDARLLVDRDGFFQAILDRLKARMIENGSRRIWRGDSWYWVLKPDRQPGEEIVLL